MSNPLISTQTQVSMRRVCVTTPRKTSSEEIGWARELARWFGCSYEARRDRGLERLFDEADVNTIIVADDPVKIHHQGLAGPMFFHPSMAAQRIIRQERGEKDRLVEAAAITPGDVVVDATLGLASDALVLARAAGMNGQVIGLESSLLTAQMLRCVQRFGSRRYSDAANLLKSVHIHAVHHEDWLHEQPSASVDVIYFDPMFRSPNEDSSSLAPLRPFADASPLLAATLTQAKRVARRCVVIKERPSSGLFTQHGFVPDHPRRKIAYGVWHKEYE